jgi:hypothetical protein
MTGTTEKKVAATELPPANELDVTFAPVHAKHGCAPRRSRQHALHVEVVPVPAAERDALAGTFWTLIGDFAADVLLDRVDGPWASHASPHRESLAS